MTKRDDVMAEVVAEMNRTDDNIEKPSFGDYAADIIRRLTFIVDGGEFANNIPRPGDSFQGRTVIASVYFEDELWLMILLNEEPSYFSVVTVDIAGEIIRGDDKFDNIVPAVQHYVESGGDF